MDATHTSWRWHRPKQDYRPSDLLVCFSDLKVSDKYWWIRSPITSTSPASKYWGIDQSIRYGSQTILPTTAGIVDTGTTLILLATDAYKAYVSATGATPDSSTGLLTISNSQYSQLESLFFEAGGVSSMLGNCYILISHSYLAILWACPQCTNLASIT